MRSNFHGALFEWEVGINIVPSHTNMLEVIGPQKHGLVEELTIQVGVTTICVPPCSGVVGRTIPTPTIYITIKRMKLIPVLCEKLSPAVPV